MNCMFLQPVQLDKTVSLLINLNLIDLLDSGKVLAPLVFKDFFHSSNQPTSVALFSSRYFLFFLLLPL